MFCTEYIRTCVHGFFLENTHIAAVRSNHFLNNIYNHVVKPTNFLVNIHGTRNSAVSVPLLLE